MQLGYGEISKYTKGRALRFVVSSKAGLRRVVTLCNGKFVGWNKFNQLLKRNYDKRFNFSLKQPKNENLALNNFWLCGFIEADGCFNITVRKCNTSITKTRIDLRLTPLCGAKAIAQKDKYLLEQIQRVFTTSQIYEAKNIKNTHYRLTISGYKRLPMVIHYFDTYPLQTHKYTHYRMFRRCFRFMQPLLHKVELKKHLNHKGLQQVKTMQNTLTSIYKQILLN